MTVDTPAAVGSSVTSGSTVTVLGGAVVGRGHILLCPGAGARVEDLRIRGVRVVVGGFCYVVRFQQLPAQGVRQGGREQNDLGTEHPQPPQQVQDDMVHVGIVGVDLVEDDDFSPERKEAHEGVPYREGTEHGLVDGAQADRRQQCLPRGGQPGGGHDLGGRGRLRLMRMYRAGEEYPLRLLQQFAEGVEEMPSSVRQGDGKGRPPGDAPGKGEGASEQRVGRSLGGQGEIEAGRRAPGKRPRCEVLRDLRLSTAHRLFDDHDLGSGRLTEGNAGGRALQRQEIIKLEERSKVGYLVGIRGDETGPAERVRRRLPVAKPGQVGLCVRP